MDNNKIGNEVMRSTTEQFYEEDAGSDCHRVAGRDID